MAGDKGWTTPALTAGATRREVESLGKILCGVNDVRRVQGLSTSITCGLAMTAATGIPYRHLFFVVAERITPASDDIARHHPENCSRHPPSNDTIGNANGR